MERDVVIFVICVINICGPLYMVVLVLLIQIKSANWNFLTLQVTVNATTPFIVEDGIRITFAEAT